MLDVYYRQLYNSNACSYEAYYVMLYVALLRNIVCDIPYIYYCTFFNFFTSLVKKLKKDEREWYLDRANNK